MADRWEDDPLAFTSQSRTGAVPRQTNRGGRFNGGGTSRGNVPHWSGRGVNWNFRGGDRGVGGHRFSSPRQTSKAIYVPSHKVGRIIGKGGLKIRELERASDTDIKVGHANDDHTTKITIYGDEEGVSRVTEIIDGLIVEKKFAPAPPRDPYVAASAPAQMKSSDSGVEMMHSNNLNAYYDALQKERWNNLPIIIKDFYVEDPVVAAKSPEDVALWRKENNDIQVQRILEDSATDGDELRPVPNPVLTFEQAFWNYPDILREINKQDFDTPSPIQSQAWPILLRGEDLIGIAQTGKGKILAFLLPALIHIDGQTIPRDQREGPSVLVLAPTRELAIQIEKEAAKYQYKDIKSVCIYGGAQSGVQFNFICKRVDIIIATPGRLNDLIMGNHIKVINFSYIVLYEAHKMLDLGLEPQIKNCLCDVRPNRQMVMMSSTFSSGMRRLVMSYMKNPIHVNVESLDLAAAHSVTQKFQFVEEDDKINVLLDFIFNMEPTDKVIIYCRKKTTATQISADLDINGLNCQSLLEYQAADQSALQDSPGETTTPGFTILIATDVASKGIDVKNVTHVVNFDFPRYVEEYVYRVGRASPGEKTGIALSLMTKYDYAHAREIAYILSEGCQELPVKLEKYLEKDEGDKGPGGGYRGIPRF